MEKKVNVNGNDKVIQVYRYMWLFEGNDNMCIKVVSGLPEEHSKFIEALKTDPRVKKAVRVYLHEYDVNLIEFYEGLVDDEQNNEKDGEKK